MRIARAVSGMIAVALGFSAAACGGPSVYQGEGAKVPLAPAGVYVDQDVASGFGAFEATLARWGRWSPDARYGVQWCPNPNQVAGYGLPFEPYRTGGHWGANAEKPVYGAPPGTPYWVSDDSETWGEITMHHGYWVQRNVDPTGGARARDWCWIPGVQETAARVVWRSGGGFVGWAPEPPSWVDDGEEGLFADFDWSYVMVGALLEAFLPDQILTDDAQATAAGATIPARSMHGNPLVRLGPAAGTVTAARRELAAYIRAHPEIPAASTSEIAHASARASGVSGVSNGANAPAGSTGNGGAASSESTSSGPDAKSKNRKSSDDERMPQASIVADMMMRDPMIGPVGITPRFTRPSMQPLNPAIDDSLDATFRTGRYTHEEGSSSAGSSTGSSSSGEGGGHSGLGSFVSAVSTAVGSASSSHSSSSHESTSSHSSEVSHSSSSSSASSSSTSSHSSARAPK